MNLGLCGRNVVVTGASLGIGRATALSLAAEGAGLLLAARNEQRLAAAAEETRRLGAAEVATLVGDMTSTEGLARLREAVDALPSVWSVVTCVGSTPFGSFDEVDDDSWLRAIDMKFMATVRAVRAVLPALRRGGGGRIVLVAGNTALEPDPWMVTSGPINAALGNLAATLGRQLGPEGIGVVSIHPGPTRSGRYDALESSIAARLDSNAETAREFVRDRIPRGEVATPAEVATAISYLCSPCAVHLTGTGLGFDGGQSWAR